MMVREIELPVVVAECFCLMLREYVWKRDNHIFSSAIPTLSKYISTLIFILHADKVAEICKNRKSLSSSLDKMV